MKAGQNSLLHQKWILGLIVWAVMESVSYGQGSVSSSAVTAKPVGLAAEGMPLDSMTFDFNRDITVQLIPFDDMFKLALAYSPAVKFEGAVANSQLSAYQLAKLQVLQNLTGFVNYSTGNQAILSTGTNATDQLAQISNGYRAGVNVVISLHDLFARPQQIRLAKANHDATLERKRIAEIYLKRELYNLYQDLILSQRVLQIRLRDDQASLAAFRIAEVELQKGKITPEAHAFNSNRYAETRTTVEQAKTQFIKNIYALELFVGVPIHQLKRD
ncbi:TolC family protein [Spirosoma taeanense]|uniref:TolC family protein n=2 Tax=Spirosoma taeanense TaxID=2735870 RepID=A0A6M5YED2_9BACT|nr:TolC family protein [Spirosoma taeanense]